MTPSPLLTRNVRTWRLSGATLGLLLVLGGLGVSGCTGVGEETAGPPNVLMIVIDTLRADRLTPYGYDRDTSPTIAGRLAEHGTVFDHAYAPAPWTLPSMVGLMTGRSPGALVRGGAGSFALPEDVPVLAERLADLGYATGGFYANPTLHAGNGFARGFDAFHTPPPETASLQLHADSLLERVLPWLRERRETEPERPFFLYAHFLDPHDPYDNPDNEAHRWPWLSGSEDDEDSEGDGDYDGPLTGHSVHGLYTGHLTTDAAGVAWISALYDGEIAHVDRFVGRLLDALETLDPETLANTLVVLTADHGEELNDHRGWKHGESLYQEQLRVPLIVRWDAGGVPAGARVAEAVSLLDLLPTVLTAAGGEVPPGAEGIDLLPRLRGEEPWPRRGLYARHFGRGPLRAGVVVAPYKLVLFNRQAPFAPTDPVEEHLWRLDVERLARVELYDLDQDPGERKNLASERPDLVARLAPEILRHLDRELPGVRVMRAPVASKEMQEKETRKGVLSGRLELAHEPSGWQPIFLGPEDRVAIEGRRITFELTDEVFAKGFLVEGDVGALTDLALHRNGEPLAAESTLVGAGRPVRNGEGTGGIELASLETDEWPGSWPDGVRLRIWTRRLRPPSEEDPETVRGLRNLGYVGDR